MRYQQCEDVCVFDRLLLSVPPKTKISWVLFDPSMPTAQKCIRLIKRKDCIWLFFSPCIKALSAKDELSLRHLPTVRVVAV